MKVTKIIIEVVAGITPNQPNPKYTKQFYIDNEDLSGDDWLKVHQVYTEASAYMESLWNPTFVNWVNCTWIYL